MPSTRDERHADEGVLQQPRGPVVLADDDVQRGEHHRIHRGAERRRTRRLRDEGRAVAVAAGERRGDGVVLDGVVERGVGVVDHQCHGDPQDEGDGQHDEHDGAPGSGRREDGLRIAGDRRGHEPWDNPTVAAAEDGTIGGRWVSTIEPVCTICRTAVSRPTYVVDGHRIVRCVCCGHLYVSPRPAMDDVVAIYGEDYFENPAFRETNHEAYFGYMDYLPRPGQHPAPTGPGPRPDRAPRVEGSPARHRLRHGDVRRGRRRQRLGRVGRRPQRARGEVGPGEREPAGAARHGRRPRLRRRLLRLRDDVRRHRAPRRSPRAARGRVAHPAPRRVARDDHPRRRVHRLPCARRRVAGDEAGAGAPALLHGAWARPDARPRRVHRVRAALHRQDLDGPHDVGRPALLLRAGVRTGGARSTGSVGPRR